MKYMIREKKCFNKNIYRSTHNDKDLHMKTVLLLINIILRLVIINYQLPNTVAIRFFHVNNSTIGHI